LAAKESRFVLFAMDIMVSSFGLLDLCADMLKIFTKNRQNISYFLDFSGNAHEFLIICTKTSKY